MGGPFGAPAGSVGASQAYTEALWVPQETLGRFLLNGREKHVFGVEQLLWGPPDPPGGLGRGCGDHF